MKQVLIFTFQAVVAAALLAACATPVAPTSPPDTAIQITATTLPLVSTSEPKDDSAFLSEEQLAFLIVETVIRVDVKTEILITTTTQAAADDSMTEEEIRQALIVMRAANAEISAVEGAIRAYRDRYAQLDPETAKLLIAMQEDLDEINTAIDAIIASLEDDLEASLDMVGHLSHVITEADLQDRVESWQKLVLTQMDLRERLYINIQPQAGRVANNRVDALIQTHDFIDAFQEALSDGTFTPDELSQISQLAANARAGLYNTGNPPLFDYAQSIDRLVRNAARGEWALARNEIDTLRRSLPARPRP